MRVFTFMPGGMGVNLVKQYRQAGLADHIPLLSAFTVDESTLPAQQDAAVGMFGGANWAPEPRHSAEQEVRGSLREAAYNSVPGTYAMQAYDAAMLIDSAVNAVEGRPLEQGRGVCGAEEGRLHVAARRLQVQHQRLSRSRISILTKVAKRAGRASSRPRSSRRCFRITAIATPRTALRSNRPGDRSSPGRCREGGTARCFIGPCLSQYRNPLSG